MIENVTCPECGGPMKSRANKATGQRFWGCSAYPKCKGTRDTDGNAKADRRATSIPETVDEGLPSERVRQNDRSRWR